MKNNWLKKLTPHIIAIIVFIVLGFAYCSPMLQGSVLQQGDMVQVEGMIKEAKDFYDNTGEHPLWSNSMFGGMPTFVTYTGPSANLVFYVNKLFTLFLPQPVNMLFLAMLGFYFLLAVLDFKYYIRLFGAIAFGFSSYNIIIIAAGHVTKMMCMAYMAPVIAAILLVYRGKYLLGGALTALLGAAMVYNNHIQVMYYTFIFGVCIVVAHFIRSIRKGELKQFFIATAVLVAGAVFAVLPSSDTLLITKEYSKYSIRDSHSELTQKKGNNESHKGGLDIDYAFAWSMGKMETFSILIPNVYGGPVSPDFAANSEVYKTLSNAGVPPQQAATVAGQLGSHYYWGPQPFTTPIYFGAIVCFLFVLSLFIVSSWHKWWLLALAIIGIVLSWGKHFAGLNNFLFYHLPFYDKFRSPSMALTISEIAFVLLAAWALQDLTSSKLKKEELWKAVKYAFFITGGLVALVGLGIFLDFRAPNDDQILRALGGNEMAQQVVNAMRNDRASLLHSDAFRSFMLILLATAVLWAYVKGKLKFTPMIAAIGLLLLFDLWQVDKRDMNDNNFTDDTIQSAFQPSPADLQILKDKSPYYRVLNLAAGAQDPGSLFNGDAFTSYFHKSIGGYSPAKLWRYQDLIDYQLMPAITRLYSILQNTKTMDSSVLNIFTGSPVLNMLNTKYFIVNPQGAPIENPAAAGNAWFVQQVQWVPDADKEISSLNNIDPRSTAVMDQRYKSSLGNFIPAADSTAAITLTQYGLNELKYASNNDKEGLGVFSDIYYPAGWKAYIDGKESPILRVNYLLRGLKIPPGKHTIDFAFRPQTYFLGMHISRYSSLAVLLFCLGVFIREILRAKAAPGEKQVKHT